MPFDLWGRMRVDYSELDRLDSEVKSRTAGVEGEAALTLDDTQVRNQIADVLKTQENLRLKMQEAHVLTVKDSSMQAALRRLGDKANALRWDLGYEHMLKLRTEDAQAKLTTMSTQAATWADAMGEGMDKFAEHLSELDTSKIKGSAGGLSGFALGGMALTGAAVLGGVTASTLGESVNTAYSRERMATSVGQAFGQNASAYIEQADKLSESTGFMATQLMQAQISLNKVGITAGLEAEHIQTLTSLATDLAATSGLPAYKDNIQAVTQALISGVGGSATALADFGVNLDETVVKQLAVNAQYATNWEALTQTEKAQAYYNAILAQTGDVAGTAADDLGASQRRMQQKWAEVKEDMGEAILPVVETLADLVASIPKPVMQAGAITALIGGSVASLGLFATGLNSMMGGIGNLGGLFGGFGGKLASTTVNLGGLNSMVGSLGTTCVSSVAGIGALAAAVGALAAYLVDIAEDTDKANEQTADMAERGVEMEQIKTAKLTGIGNVNDPEQAKFVATSWAMIGGQLASFNVYGQRLSAQAEEWQQRYRASGQAGREGAEGRMLGVRIQIQDQTTKGVQATDAGSHAELIY